MSTLLELNNSRTPRCLLATCHNARLPAFPSVTIIPRFAIQLLVLVVSCVTYLATTHADTIETFESPDISWNLAESDCQAQAAVHQRRLQGAHSGQGCEYLRLIHGQGSAIYLTHRIDPSPIIAEWSPSLWLKADRPGLQLLARVVLPRTIDPRTGRPVTTFLFGTSYRETTLWQHLTIDNPVLALERQVRALRSQWGNHVDARQAYVDMLVINAYAQGGSTQIWIDDLEVHGHVELRVAPEAVPFSSRGSADRSGKSSDSPASAYPVAQASATTERSPPLRLGDAPIRSAHWETPAATPSTPAPSAPVRIQGAMLTVANKPFLPRVVRWRGEPFDWLQELGFNTLLLSDAPTREQLAEARRRGLWLMIPPPRRTPAATRTAAAAPESFAGLDAATSTPSLQRAIQPEDEDCVLAWHVGEAPDLQLPDLPEYRDLWMRQIPAAQRRPVVASASSSLHEWSRTVDVLATDLWSTSRIARTSSQRASLAVDAGSSVAVLSDVRTGIPVWAEVPLPRLPERAPGATSESAKNPRTKPTPGAPPKVAAPNYAEHDLVRVRWTVYQALSDGARGFLYSAPDSLEPGRAELRPLLSTIRTINAELALLEPWVAASDGIDLATPTDSRYQVRILHNERARLAVVLRDADSASESSVPQRSKPYSIKHGAPNLSFVDPAATNGAEAYEVTPQGLRPLQRRRVTGGVEISFERDPAFALVLITQQPVVVNYMTRRLASGRGSPVFR